MSNWQVALAIATLILGSGGGSALLVKYFRPPPTQREQLQDAIAQNRDNRGRIESLENDLRMLGDYVHELRQHIADGKPPPPPPWPEGLTS